MREKLIEILETVVSPKELLCDGEVLVSTARVADHLIANGVTFAEDNNVPSKWIPVTERLPESEKIVLVSAKSKTFGYRHTLMVAHIGHHEFTTEEYGWHEYEGETEYDEENDCFWIPECWYEVNSVEDNGNWIIDSDYDVTHWMPLPSTEGLE
jgi:hypothetical protein